MSQSLAICELWFTAQWASFSKKLQKLIILAPLHIFLVPIQGKGKIARVIRIWTEKFEKSSFSKIWYFLN
jgi:hypothetical protein